MPLVAPSFVVFLLLVCLALLCSSAVRCQMPHYKSRAYQQQEEHEVNKLVSSHTATHHSTAQHCIALDRSDC